MAGVQTKVILGSDVDHTALTDIVTITKSHKNEDRLEADVWKLPHHSSYLTLGPERGDDETEPVENVAWLFEDQLQRGGIIVSTSWPIPTEGSDEDKSPQPPHRQAANYYKRIVGEKDGEYIVTMEHPRVSDPRPLVIEVDYRKARVKRSQLIGAAALTPVSAPGAG